MDGPGHVLRSGRVRNAHNNNSAMLNTPHLLGVPQELRDQIFSHLLPDKIEVDIRSNQHHPEGPRAEIWMKPCADREACDVLRKVSRKTRSAITLLLDEHISSMTLIIDVSHPSPSIVEVTRMNPEYLKRINHVQIMNCYSVEHGNPTGQPFNEDTFLHTSLQRLTLMYSRYEHGSTSNSLSLTKVQWHRFKKDKDALLNTRDQTIFKDQIESFLAFRLPEFQQFVETPAEKSIRSECRYLRALTAMMDAMDFEIGEVYTGNGAKDLSLDSRYGTREGTEMKLWVTEETDVGENWEVSGEVQDELADELIDNFNRDALGLEVFGDMPA